MALNQKQILQRIKKNDPEQVTVWIVLLRGDFGKLLKILLLIVLSA